MNGAEAVARTLTACGVEVCFANPGTSEIHFVAALDDVPGIRGVPALFEGVATGAADGYGRMADRPAATLLHLGPGLANGVANLHNARRAKTPIVNIVGDHATYHKRYDAPLESDIHSLGRNVSRWIRTSKGPVEVGRDAAEAVAAAQGPPGQIATLILPADVSWLEGAEPASPRPRSAYAAVADGAIGDAATALGSGERCALLLGGSATRGAALTTAGRVARATDAALLCETFPARLERGAGRPRVQRLAYFPEFARTQLTGTRHLILVGARAPVSFFAHPTQPSCLVPDGCRVHRLATDGQDALAALGGLADAVGAGPEAIGGQPERPARATGPLTDKVIAAVVGALLPEGAIVCDEANSAGGSLDGATAGAPPHDWLTLTGGAIGQGMPLAIGAAIACPGRKVLSLEADGSAMYTLQALWTQAREGLDVTTVVLSNHAYAVLNVEFSRTGTSAPGSPGPEMFHLRRPELDFVALAKGMGVPASRAATAEEFAKQLRTALAEPGPALVDVSVSGFPPRL